MVKVEELNWNFRLLDNYLHLQRTRSTHAVQPGGTVTHVWVRQSWTFADTDYSRAGRDHVRYNLDDTVQTVTDARNAVTTFSYNPRNWSPESRSLFREA